MAIRTYDNGSFYSVSIGEDELYNFRKTFPASGLSNLRNIWAQFDRRNGDLVDMRCNGRDCERFDGSGLSALLGDMQCIATEKGRKAKAPKMHCRK